MGTIFLVTESYISVTLNKHMSILTSQATIVVFPLQRVNREVPYLHVPVTAPNRRYLSIDG